MADQQGSWGGARPGAGNPEFKPKWKSGKTTVIRVPEAIADQVLAAARQIDEGGAVTLSSNETADQEQPQDNAVTQSSIDPATLFNQLRPLLNRLSDRERRAIQQKLEEVLG
jgi:hypothetical protein